MKQKSIYFRIAAALTAILLVLSCNKQETGGAGDIARISLSQTKAELSRGDKLQLSATAVPSSAADRGFAWSSSDKDVVTVTSGLLTAVSDGKATVTVRPVEALLAGNMSIYAQCEVIVSTVYVRELSFSLTSYDVALTRGSFRLEHSIVPKQADKPGVLDYKVVSGGDIVSVDNDGLVTLKALGTAKIEVTTMDGSDISVQLTVNVQEADIWPTDFNFDYKEDMVVGTNQRIRLIYEPATANRKEIVMVMSGGSDCVEVKKISDEEIEVKAVQVTDGGKWADTGVQILVTVKTENGNTTGSRQRYIWVHAGEPSVSVSGTQPTPWGTLADGLVVGEKPQLQVDVQNLHKDLHTGKVALNYESSNPDVLSVDEDGLLNAKAKGAAWITASTMDGKFHDNIFLQVYGVPASVTSGLTDLFVRYASTQPLTFSVKDAEGKQSRQAVDVSLSGLASMAFSLENYHDNASNALVNFTSTRSAASTTVKGTATVRALGYPSVTTSVNIYDAMYDADDIKPFDGIKFNSGRLIFVDGGYRGSGFFSAAPTAYQFRDCKALVVWSGQRSSLDDGGLSNSRLSLDGQSRFSGRAKVNGFAIAWKNAYTVVPSATSDNDAHWQRTHTTVDRHANYYDPAPVWKGKTPLQTTNTYQYGYEITQAENFYNSKREDAYDIWPVRNLARYDVTPPAAPVTSGWYVPTSGEWYMMLTSLTGAGNAANKVSDYLQLMDGGERIFTQNGVLYRYWSCQEGGSDKEKTAVYVTGNSATAPGTQPALTQDKKSGVACTRAFLAF